MDKIWFLFIDGKQEGPYSFEELKKERRITPDTLVWREGFKNWKKIREVSELQALFEEDSKNGIDKETEISEKKTGQDELILEMSHEPPYFLWILIALIILLYMVVQLYTF